MSETVIERGFTGLLKRNIRARTVGETSHERVKKERWFWAEPAKKNGH